MVAALAESRKSLAGQMPSASSGDSWWRRFPSPLEMVESRNALKFVKSTIRPSSGAISTTSTPNATAMPERTGGRT